MRILFSHAMHAAAGHCRPLASGFAAAILLSILGCGGSSGPTQPDATDGPFDPRSTTEETAGCEAGWSRGTPIGSRNQPARYFQIEGQAHVVPLGSPNGKPAPHHGYVAVTRQDHGFGAIQLNVDPGWCIVEAQVYVGFDPPTSPAPGKWQLHHSGPPAPQITFPYGGDPTKPIYVAVHIVACPCGGTLPPSVSAILQNRTLDDGEKALLIFTDILNPGGGPLETEIDFDNDGDYETRFTCSEEAPCPEPVIIESPDPYFFQVPAPDIRTIPIRLRTETHTVDYEPALTCEIRDPANPLPTFDVEALNPTIPGGSFVGLHLTEVQGAGDTARVLIDWLNNGNFVEVATIDPGDQPGELTTVSPMPLGGSTPQTLQIQVRVENTVGATDQTVTVNVAPAPNQPPGLTATLLPNAVLDGGSSVLQIQASDFEGLPLRCRVDLDNDGIFEVDAPILAPYGLLEIPIGPLFFQVPAPDIRFFPTEVSDGTNDVVADPVPELEVLDPNPNRAPSATAWLEQTDIPTSSDVTLLLEGFEDPDGDSIDVDVKWTELGEWVNSSMVEAPYPVLLALESPDPYEFGGTAPDIRTIQVRIRDPFETVNLPDLTFEVLPPATGSDWWVSHADLGSTPWATNGGGAIGSWKFTDRPGWIVQNQLSFFNFNWTQADGPTLTQMSNPSTSMLPGYVYSIDTNHANRVFYLASPQYSTAGFGQGSPQEVYGSGAGRATTILRWFDYNGTLVSSANGISLPLPAVCLTATAAHGSFNDEIYYMDINSLIHKLTRTGATTYAESTTGGFPLNLGTSGTILPVGLRIDGATIRVQDIAMDEFSRKLYVLTENNSPTGPRGAVYRLNANGTFDSSGGTNPLVLDLNQGFTPFTFPADISIDNHDATGAVLNGAQSQRIMVTSIGVTNRVGEDPFDFTLRMIDTHHFADAPTNNGEFARRVGVQPVEDRALIVDRATLSFGVDITHW